MGPHVQPVGSVDSGHVGVRVRHHEGNLRFVPQISTWERSFGIEHHVGRIAVTVNDLAFVLPESNRFIIVLVVKVRRYILPRTNSHVAKNVTMCTIDFMGVILMGRVKLPHDPADSKLC